MAQQTRGADIVRTRGAMVLVDAYQGLGTRPLDIVAKGMDFLVGGCTKFAAEASLELLLEVGLEPVEAEITQVTDLNASEI